MHPTSCNPLYHSRKRLPAAASVWHSVYPPDFWFSVKRGRFSTCGPHPHTATLGLHGGRDALSGQTQKASAALQAPLRLSHWGQEPLAITTVRVVLSQLPFLRVCALLLFLEKYFSALESLFRIENQREFTLSSQGQGAGLALKVGMLVTPALLDPVPASLILHCPW